MDVDQQQQHSPFASSDAHFSPQPQIQQQQSPSQSQRQQPHQQQQHRLSPESPSQSLSQSHIQNQGQSQGQNQWPSAQQQHHPHILTLSLPVSGSLTTVSASPTSYSPASAHPADGYPFYAQQTQPQSQSQVPGADGGHHGHSQSHNHQGMERTASLSLNISSLSVQSPATLSPLTPSPHPSTASTAQTLSPVTPLSPSTTPHAQHYQTQTTPSNRHPGQGQGQGSMFAYAPPPEIPYSTSGPYDTSASTPAVTLPAYARAPSSRSSSAASTALSTKSSIPRKRSFTNAASLPVTTLGMGEPGPVPGYNPALGQSAHDLASSAFDDVDVDLYSGSGGLDHLDGRGGGGSPGDGGDSSSGDGDEDPFKSLSLGVGSNHSGTGMGGLSSLSIPQQGGGYGGPVSAKSTGTNNFVTKLYQMINDPKSTMFIQWTELGTSFVVSNVGEFSRTILGAHFKHNNFSSFVRQLNMYGFHKINRGRQTPRGTRASGSGQNSAGSTDQQVWEFSHHKFLRGRPDLLDEIKRKALDPDPAIKQRVELPGELAAQLGQMRENHRRVVRALEWERTKVDRLVGVMRGLYDVVGRAFPGSVPSFPPELWETPENNPPIFVTSPTAPSPGPASARAYGSANGVTTNGMTLPSAFPSLQPFSPGSSPTGSEFTHPGHAGQYAHPMHHGHHGHAGHQHHLNRAHSMQNIPYDSSYAAPSPISAGPRYEDPMDLDGSGMGLGDRKRQRTGPGLVLGSMEGKRLSRARSDSAPLGYGVWGTGAPPGTVGRPRSGSGLAQANTRAAAATPHGSGRRDDMMVNISNIGNGKGAGQQAQGQSVTSPLVQKASG